MHCAVCYAFVKYRIKRVHIAHAKFIYCSFINGFIEYDIWTRKKKKNSSNEKIFELAYLLNPWSFGGEDEGAWRWAPVECE